MKYVVLIAGLFLFACGEKKQPAEPVKKESNTDTAAKQAYFPVLDFLKAEIAYVDSLPVAILKYTTIGKHTDSGYIKLPEFRSLAAEFIPYELNDSIFTKNFKETSFYDNNTNSGTFFYSNIKNVLELKRVDVISAKTDTYDKVKSIYLEKVSTSGDTSIIKRLFWKTQRNFQIIIQKSQPAKPPVTEVIKVVWDNRE
ncbi:MAG: hypothetical protein ABI415_04190 [Flavitalea sp.]